MIHGADGSGLRSYARSAGSTVLVRGPFSGGVSSPVISTPGLAAVTPAPGPGKGVIRAMITVPRPKARDASEGASVSVLLVLWSRPSEADAADADEGDMRDRVAIIDADAATATEHPADGLFDALRADRRVADSDADLDLSAGVCIGSGADAAGAHSVVLFQKGRGVKDVNPAVVIKLADLFAYTDANGAAPASAGAKTGYASIPAYKVVNVSLPRDTAVEMTGSMKTSLPVNAAITAACTVDLPIAAGDEAAAPAATQFVMLSAMYKARELADGFTPASIKMAALALVPASKLLTAAAATPVGPAAVGSLRVVLLRDYISKSPQSYERQPLRLAALHATGIVRIAKLEPSNGRIASSIKNLAGKVPPKREGAGVALDLMAVAQTAKDIRCTELHQLKIVVPVACLAKSCI